MSDEPGYLDLGGREFLVETHDLADDAMLIHHEWFAGVADDGKIEFSMNMVMGAPTLLLSVTKGGVTKRGTMNLSKLTAAWVQSFVEEM